MLCRALVTAIAISYLICVLVLNGIQKEDLDVSLLQKLQKHKINTNDINNEKLRNECLSKRSLNKHDGARVLNERSYDPSTRTVEASTTIDMTKAKKLTHTLDGIDVETINRFKNTSTPYADKVVLPLINTQGYNILERSHGEENDSKKISNTFATDISGDLRIEYIQVQPQLGSVIKFWDTIVKRTTPNRIDFVTTNMPSIITTSIDDLQITTKQIGQKGIIHYDDTPIDRNSNTKPTIDNFKNIDSNEIEHINKVLQEYVSGQFSTRQKRKEHLNSISQEIEKLLAGNMRNGQNVTFSNMLHNKVEESTHNPVTIMNDAQNTQSNNRSYLNKSIQRKVDEIINRFSRPTGVNSNYFVNDNSNSPFKTQIKFENRENVPTYTMENVQQKEADNLVSRILIQNSTPDNYSNVKTVTSNDINKDEIKHLSPDVLRQIAETVKEIVLRDLKNEIIITSTQSTTMSSTTVTSITDTTTTISRTLDQDKLQRATQAIEDFIKVFEQFKSIKEKPATISFDTKFKSPEKVDKLQTYNVPINVMYHAPLTPIISYGMVHQSMNIAPRIVDPYISPHPSVTQHFTPNNPKPINIIARMQPTPIVNIRVNQMHPAPIMIQTNSREIPPLGIPISEPQLMNQHIVLTTLMPPASNKGDRDRWNYIIKYSRNPDSIAEINNRKESLSAYSNLNLQEHEQEFNKPVQRERQKDIFQDDYNEKYIREPLHYRERTEVPQDIHSIKGFHERLEGVDEWPQESYDTNFENKDIARVNIASRQQRPLHTPMGSNFDDTHFKNFLKTQQKVNDMLERILATRTDVGRARSVETT